MDHVSVLHCKIQRHAPGRRDGVASDAAPWDLPEPVEVVHHHHGHEGRHAGAEGVADQHKAIVGPAIPKEVAQCVGLAVEQPGCGLEQAEVDVAAVEGLGTGRVVEQEAVVGVVAKVEATDGKDDFAGGAVNVEEVGRAAAAGVGVGGAFDDGGGIHPIPAGASGGPAGAGEVVFVGRKDGAAGAGNGGELIGRGGRPGGAVVGADVPAAAAGPPRAPQAEHALDATRHDHRRER